MKPTPKQYKEAVERHDRIVKHLIDEGYAENAESADIKLNKRQQYKIVDKTPLL